VNNIALYTSDYCLNHHVPDGHPERTDRHKAVISAFDIIDPDKVLRHYAGFADGSDLILAHPQSYLDQLFSITTDIEGLMQIDGDSYLSSGSLNAILSSVGCVTQATRDIVEGKVKKAFCGIRPPGHHAEKETAMGFCFINNVVVAARTALQNKHINKVAIFDFDVHHGNGTQDIIWDDPDILYVSTHEMPLFPGTGMPNEKGRFDNIVNIPLLPGTAGADYMLIIDDLVIPALQAFNPDFLIFSAGFDAHINDALANVELESEDFGLLTSRVLEGVKHMTKGKTLSVLEGGYNLAGLEEGLICHIKSMQNDIISDGIDNLVE